MIAEILSCYIGISIVACGMGNSHSRSTCCSLRFPASGFAEILAFSFMYGLRWAAAQTCLGTSPQTPCSLRAA